MEIKVYDYLHEDSVFVRTEVFINEQKFREEFDDMEKMCKHVLVYDEDKPVGNCRFYKTDDNVYAIGRFAVLKEYRGKKLGRMIIEKAEECIKDMGGTEVVLNAQVRVKGFYEKMGYICEGEEFLDEGCPHIAMRKKLNNN